MRLAEAAANERSNQAEPLRVLGAALLRTGATQPAVEQLRESVRLAPHPATLYLLAIVEHRAGRADAVREAFDRAKAAAPGPLSWLDRQELRWFAAEAEKAVRP